MTAEVWLFAEPIDPSTSRYLIASQSIEEAIGRGWLIANGYEVSDPMWHVPCGLLADEEPAYRDHEIRRDGALYGWLRVYEDAPPAIEEEIRSKVQAWAQRTLRDFIRIS